MIIHHVKSDCEYAAIVSNEPGQSPNLNLLSADELGGVEFPLFSLDDSTKKVGNFLYAGDSVLVFDDIVYESIGEIMEGAGEVFTVHVQGLGERYILNVTDCCNAIDKSQSQLSKEGWAQTLADGSLVFKPNRVGTWSGLFKVPELEYIPILSFTGREEQFNDLYISYNRFGFTGLEFDKIWEG